MKSDIFKMQHIPQYIQYVIHRLSKIILQCMVKNIITGYLGYTLNKTYTEKTIILQYMYLHEIMKCETGSTKQIIKLKILTECTTGVYVTYVLLFNRRQLKL